MDELEHSKAPAASVLAAPRESSCDGGYKCAPLISSVFPLVSASAVAWRSHKPRLQWALFAPTSKASIFLTSRTRRSGQRSSWSGTDLSLVAGRHQKSTPQWRHAILRDVAPAKPAALFQPIRAMNRPFAPLRLRIQSPAQAPFVPRHP